MSTIETTPELVKNTYAQARKNLDIVRKRLGKPLTLAEKILYGHLDDLQNQELERGSSFLLLRPDRVAMQDATAQMALLQFMLSGKDKAAVPSTVHCDHIIRAHKGRKEDMETARNENGEVFDFLESASSRYGIGFWKPGAGIIHQVVLENYAFPGGLMIGTDSHTPNAGGLGMCAVGVGGADAADVMSGLPWEVKNPKIIGVHLKGKLNGWVSGKDVILKLLDILTVKGGTDKIVEYFGEGVESLSCTGKATTTNMGAELGATCSVFPYDKRMGDYLRITERSDIADVVEQNIDLCTADEEVLKDPAKFYDQVIEIDLSTLEPHLVGPHTPDLAHTISEMGAHCKENGWDPKLSAALIGSCTNSSYEDVGRATSIIIQAKEKGYEMKTPFFVSPGSTLIQNTIERDGQMQILTDAGATVLANACGPCIGQWKRDDIEPGDVNTIVTSFNRNFRARNDTNPATLGFIGSPELVTALGLAGRIDFNPLTDELEAKDGTKFKLEPPEAPEFPANGFVADREGYEAPKGSDAEVKVSPKSDRLQVLTPFTPWDGKDFEDLPVLIKAEGKCTTDHISPAGPWLKYRGHLDNISDNMFIGANNAFTDEPGTGVDFRTSEVKNLAKLARDYKADGIRWIAIGDDNYGEGSSREHAAMSPRLLNVAAVITRSFARIHETNLKKQGVFAGIFVDPADYEKIKVDDKLNLRGLDKFAPGVNLTLEIQHKDGSMETAEIRHTYNAEQIKWFKAGSALNLLRKQ
jgi:aconitate hydratase